MSYKRSRKKIIKERDQWQYNLRKETIKTFQSSDEYNLFYYDESGVSIHSNIPYFWSKTDEQVCIDTNKRERLNILGFLNTKTKELFYQSISGKVCSDRVIDAFNKFINSSSNIKKKTIIVLDNARIHRSKKFQKIVDLWAKQNFFVLYLPPYSPKLNLIEILWKHLKYIWINPSAFFSFSSLKSYVTHTLNNFGYRFDIDFA